MELKKKDDILRKEEETMRLKSRVIWIEAGDNNTKFSTGMLLLEEIKILFGILILRKGLKYLLRVILKTLLLTTSKTYSRRKEGKKLVAK